MPIKVPDNLPAKDVLIAENIFAMNESRAFSQDIRPLKIAILNLMPKKQETEVQLLRLLGNTALQIEATLLRIESYIPKHTTQEYLAAFYTVFENIKNKKFDGLIITGAPVEHLEFERVSYWPELTRVLNWCKTNVNSTMFICWAAQAALYHYYGVPKFAMGEKLFGVFEHRTVGKTELLTRGFDDKFFVPHSRNTYVRKEDILEKTPLAILAESDEAGVYLAASRDGRQVYATGHAEYDPCTLKQEYERDLGKGAPIAIPKNYFTNDDPSAEPVATWRSLAHLLFANWLNYCVYQITPYDIEKVGQ